MKPVITLSLITILTATNIAFADIDLDKFMVRDKGTTSVNSVRKKRTQASRKIPAIPAVQTAAIAPPARDEHPVEQFTVSGDLVLDRRNGIAWAKNANIANRPLKFKEMEMFIETLNSTVYLGYSDWRLPTANELDSLISFAMSGGYAVIGKPAADYFNNTVGFKEFQQDLYFSTSDKEFSRLIREGKGFTGSSINFSGTPMEDMQMLSSKRGSSHYVIPVRSLSPGKQIGRDVADLSVFALFSFVSHAYKMKEYKELVTRLNRTLQENPSSGVRDLTLYWLARLQYKSGNFKEAVRFMLQFRREYPSHPLKDDVEERLLAEVMLAEGR